MDLGSVFLILALLVLVGLFIARPLFERTATSQPEDPQTGEKPPAAAADHVQSTLLAERDRVLNALQELDFDNILGKIPAEDYPQQRTVLLQQGADVLRQLDALQAQAGQAAENTVEDRIESAIAARRADLQSAQTAAGGNGHGRGVSAAIASPDDELEVLLASRRRVRSEKAAGFCPKCGRAVQKSDRFCPKCGATTD